MATAQDLYDLACFDYCEDGLLTLDIITDSQFWGMLNLTLTDWFRKTALIQRIYTQAVGAGQGLYTLPDDILRADAVFLEGCWLPKATQAELNASLRNWRRQPGPPRYWYEDGLPVKTIGLAPTPLLGGSVFAPVYDSFDANGQTPAQHCGLTVVGPSMATATVASPADPIPLVPDEFALGYLLFGVHERVFGGDNELQEKQRAIYCGAQWMEGLNLARAIAGEPGEEEG